MTATRMTATRNAILAALLAVTAASALAPAAVAGTAGFLDHRSKGMQACVRAILHGTDVRKHVNVHGHHFHCKPIARGIAGRRTVRLSHDQFGKDDQVAYSFRVDARGRYIRDTLEIRVSKGVSIHSLAVRFQPVANFRTMTWHDFASAVTGMKPVKVKHWQDASNQVAMVVIAQLGFLGER